jgi:hypothetical protein
VIKRHDLKTLKGALEVAIRLHESDNTLAQRCLSDKVIANIRAEYEQEAEATFNADDFPAIAQIYLDGV